MENKHQERMFVPITAEIHPVPNYKIQLFSYGEDCYGYTSGHDGSELYVFVCRSIDDFNNGKGKLIHYPNQSSELLCLRKSIIMEALYDLG